MNRLGLAAKLSLVFLVLSAAAGLGLYSLNRDVGQIERRIDGFAEVARQAAFAERLNRIANEVTVELRGMQLAERPLILPPVAARS